MAAFYLTLLPVFKTIWRRWQINEVKAVSTRGMLLA
jgi:hypothetical protein